MSKITPDKSLAAEIEAVLEECNIDTSRGRMGSVTVNAEAAAQEIAARIAANQSRAFEDGARNESALIRIIELNVQYCIDRYGDAGRAEEMACVQIARSALAETKIRTDQRNIASASRNPQHFRGSFEDGVRWMKAEAVIKAAGWIIKAPPGITLMLTEKLQERNYTAEGIMKEIVEVVLPLQPEGEQNA